MLGEFHVTSANSFSQQAFEDLKDQRKQLCSIFPPRAIKLLTADKKRCDSLLAQLIRRVAIINGIGRPMSSNILTLRQRRKVLITGGSGTVGRASVSYTHLTLPTKA